MRVQQQNNYDCLAAVLAMILSADLSEIYALLGHDGTSQKANYARRPILMREVISIAAQAGVQIGCHLSPVGGGRMVAETTTADPALLVVRGGNGHHVVFFDGNNVIDPNPCRGETYDLDDYQIMQWWPVREFSV